MKKLKIKETATMRKLRKIREAHYEATKDKNLNDVMHDVHNEAEAIIKKYHLNFFNMFDYG